MFHLQLIDSHHTEGSTAHRKGGLGLRVRLKGGRGHPERRGEGHPERGEGSPRKGEGQAKKGEGAPKKGREGIVYFLTISFLGQSTVFNPMGL